MMAQLGFRDWTIRQKLMAMSLLASSAALILVTSVLMTYDYFTSRSALVKNLATLAEIVSLNASSAVLFNDPLSAERTLTFISGHPGLLSAQIFTTQGQSFARWEREPQKHPAPPLKRTGAGVTHIFRPRSLTLYYPMVFDNARIGTLCFETNLRNLQVRLRRYAGINLSVLLASIGLAALVSLRWGRRISDPILHLTETAYAVSEHKDYSVRARKEGKDELGALTDTFNIMLAKIQEGERALTAARDELEQRVQVRTSELKAANSELESFSYSVSHDLRAPLRHISGFADLLQNEESVPLSGTARRYLETIVSSARQMGRLIDDLLAFSRMGRVEMLTSKLNLNRIIDDVLESLKAEMSGPAVEWKIDALPEVRGDSSMMRQVMVNLISNAVKYSRKAPHPKIEIGSRPGDKGEVVIFVRDNGAGFDMKYVDKLFGVFQRLHGSDEFEGTGIGLANVRRIIHRHGGRTWAEGVVNQGATFYFSMPIGGIL